MNSEGLSSRLFSPCVHNTDMMLAVLVTQTWRSPCPELTQRLLQRVPRCVRFELGRAALYFVCRVIFAVRNCNRNSLSSC